MYYDPRDADRGRLPPRHRRRQAARAAHDRRPGHALPRRPGAHRARGALRRQAGLQHRAEDRRRRWPRRCALLANVPRLAPVRRDDQAAADRPRAGQHRGSCARTGCTAACSRCSRRCYDEQRSSPLRKRFIELALADTDRRVAEGRAVAPSFLLACLLWHDVQARWHELRQRGEHADAGAAAGDRCRVRCAHRRRLGPRQAGRRHARDLDDAAALRAPPGQLGRRAGRAAAFPCRLRLPAAARRCAAKSTANWPTGGKTFRSATPTSARHCCNSRVMPSAIAVSPSRPRRVRRPKRRRRRRRSGGARGEGGAAPAPAAP